MTDRRSPFAALGLPRVLGTLRRKFFRTPLDVVVSSLVLALLGWAGWSVLDWAVVNATWTSPDGSSEVCRDHAGACWAVIDVRWRLILFGLFPFEEQWRSTIACIAIVLTGILSCIPVFWTPLRLSLLWLAGFAVFYTLMRGGVLGLVPVAPSEWGGLTLTVFVYATGILIGMPTAIALALLRRSQLPWIAHTVGLLIDTVRSLDEVADSVDIELTA